MKTTLVATALLLSASILQADISVTDRSSTLRFLANAAILRPGGDVVSAKDDAARRAANRAKRDAKHSKRHLGTSLSSASLALHPRANNTGSISLIDAAGLQYFINTNITFSTSSSASGEASEASYTGPIVASTVAGGVIASTPIDSFDGYNALCVSLTNAVTQCGIGASWTVYNKNGAAAFDATVPAVPTCTNRQVALNPQTIGVLSVKRKVFVPTNDQFIRWMNSFTNTSGAPVTFTAQTSNNLGSNANTLIINSSNGDSAAQTTDTWITTFQNFTSAVVGTRSNEPRMGHVLQGTGAPTPVSLIHFVNGDGNPYCGYSITLAPGQTKVILNFATGQGTKAAANAQAAALALLPASATQCMSAMELSQIANFAVATDLSITKNTSAAIAFGGNPITYTLAVSNLGPSPANAVSVSDTLPAGSTFVSASGTGWTCNNGAGVVTCTVATLPVGAAPVINLMINAPPVAVAGTLSNTATVSSSTADTNPANNSSTMSVPILPGNQIPALSTWMLMMLAVVLSAIRLTRRT